MRGFVGKFHNRNRLQVFLALFTFSFCAWWSLHPLGFHLLDGISIVVVMLLGNVFPIGFPFNSAAGWHEAAFLVFNTGLPLLLFLGLRRSGLLYMSSACFFWGAYAFQNWFRYFWITVYRVPAYLFLSLSLVFVYLGLFYCLKNSESSDSYADCFAEFAEFDSKNGDLDEKD